VTEWHINADEPVALDYNTNFKSANHQQSLYAPDPYRSSDHDPVLVGMDLAALGFDGFHPPVANPPAVNRVKAGRTVPLNFTLDGDQGLDVIVTGYPTVTPIDCRTGESTGPAIPAETAGRSGLSFDEETGTYTWTWKTDDRWTGCRRVTLLLTDGTIRTADFRFVS
jgi:hypothetical protein